MPWWREKWAKNAGLVAAAALGVYVLIYADVVARARESYLEAEKYVEWDRHPDEKKAFFDKKFETEKTDLDRQLSKGKISEDEHRQRLEALQFDNDFALHESSLKYAYQWYKDTFELFSPPESKWVRLARVKAPQVLEQWKNELRAQNIPFEDTMFQ